MGSVCGSASGREEDSKSGQYRPPAMPVAKAVAVPAGGAPAMPPSVGAPPQYAQNGFHGGPPPAGPGYGAPPPGPGYGAPPPGPGYGAPPPGPGYGAPPPGPYGGNGQCPVDYMTAQGFLQALWSEYVMGVTNAVGHFFDGGAAGHADVLDPYEAGVRAAPNKAGAVQNLAQQWGMPPPH